MKKRASIGAPLALVAVVGLVAVRARAKPRRVRSKVYVPGSARQIALFEEAAEVAGVPRAWASDPGLISLLKSESEGRVGVPNYTYGERSANESQWPEVWAELKSGTKSTASSATGLGQLTLPNVDEYYPDGRAGIGDALNEAVGMLRYIESRYGTPHEAWRCHGKLCTGIPGRPDKTFQEGY